MSEIRVISVRQPWAWLIIHAGKDIENRSWSTNHRGPLAIHASKAKPDPADCAAVLELAEELGIGEPQYEYGMVIGTVDVVGCVTRSRSPWFAGPVGWQLANPRPCDPWPLLGRLGLYSSHWPETVRLRQSGSV